ncbi:MAG: hypothetical protein JWM10_2362 [Myxococcaceae bacterium]|nr:hypothetical protein [Myxococcaceae bacterium]
MISIAGDRGSARSRRIRPAPRRALWLLAVSSLGCYTRLPPPEAPDFAPPRALAAGAPAPGLGRVYVDVTNAQARVYSLTPAFVNGREVDRASPDDELLSTDDGYVHSHPRCTTPCVLDLPVGPQRLLLARDHPGDSEHVLAPVGAQPLVLRRTMGARTRYASTTTQVGLLFMAASVAMSIGGGMLSSPPSEPSDHDAGIALIGFGSPLLLIGVGVALGTRETQAGTSSWWTLDGTAIR